MPSINPAAFKYDPETGDLRWAEKVARNTHVGEPAGHFDGKFLIVYHKHQRFHALHIIHFLQTGRFTKDARPVDGDWTNLKWANVTTEAASGTVRKKRLAADDLLRIKNDGVYIGSYRLKPALRRMVLRIAFARDGVTDEQLMEALWPDPDAMPDTWYNVLGVYACQINKLLQNWRLRKSRWGSHGVWRFEPSEDTKPGA